MDKIYIGIVLKRLRLSRNLTQSELARQAGLHHGFVSELESNKKEPCAGTLVALAKVLEVTVDDLLRQDEELNKLK